MILNIYKLNGDMITYNDSPDIQFEPSWKIMGIRSDSGKMFGVHMTIQKNNDDTSSCSLMYKNKYISTKSNIFSLVNGIDHSTKFIIFIKDEN